MSNSKTNVIIQCRFSSTRLPGKAMYPLCGIPLLAFLIRRMKKGLPDKMFRIIVATTTNKEDDPVAVWAEHEGVHLVRGQEDNVLSRYIKILTNHPSYVNVRVTGDNPLTCPQILINSVALLKKKNLDYVMTENFPYGTGVDVFSASLLKFLKKHAIDSSDQEHINNFILKNPDKFQIDYLRAVNDLLRPDLSMTVDTMEDFKRVSSIFAAYRDQSPWTLSLKNAIQNLDKAAKT